MSETFNPFSEAYYASHLADQARSLSSTLLLAPAQEPRRLTALRHWLSQIADALAEKCAEPADTNQIRSYKGLIFDIRELAKNIDATNHIVPSGLEIVLKAFQEQLFPDGIVILPLDASTNKGYDVIRWLKDGLETCGLAVPLGNAVPTSAFVLQYPQGEQDNVMSAPLQIAALYRKMVIDTVGLEWTKQNRSVLGDGIATRVLGPAYVLAHYAFNPTWQSTPKAISLGAQRILEEQGWFTHPTIGDLLKLTFNNSTNDTDANDLFDTPQWKALCEKFPAYTPAQFDAEVPILWERLKQLLPPNELGMDEVESEKPASLVSILNAGWSFYLLHMDDLYKILGSKTAQDKYDAKMVLNRLLTKGVELSQITQNWRTARKAIGQ